MKVRLVVRHTDSPTPTSRRFAAVVELDGELAAMVCVGDTEHEVQTDAVAILARQALKKLDGATATERVNTLARVVTNLSLQKHIIGAAATRAATLAGGGLDAAALHIDATESEQMRTAAQQWRDTAAALRALALTLDDTLKPTQENFDDKAPAR